MSKMQRRRLAALEQQSTPPGPPGSALKVVVIEGCLPGPIEWAEGAGRIWQRAVDESYETFEERVTADAKAADLESVVIGGLTSCQTASMLPASKRAIVLLGMDWHFSANRALLWRLEAA